MHLPAGRCRQRSDEKITESRAGVRAAAFPSADHVVALGNEISRAPEIEVRKRFPEVSHESLDIRVTLPWRMQRILQEHVGSGELVNDSEIACLPPEIREPTADDDLVVFFFRHYVIPLGVAC